MVTRIMLLVKLEFWRRWEGSGGGRSCRCDSSGNRAQDVVAMGCWGPEILYAAFATVNLGIVRAVAQAWKHVRLSCEIP